MPGTKPSRQPSYSDDEYFLPIPDEDSVNQPINENHSNNLAGNIKSVAQTKTTNVTDSDGSGEYFQPIPDEDSSPINNSSTSEDSLVHESTSNLDNDDAYFQPIPDDDEESASDVGCQSKSSKEHEQKLNTSLAARGKQGQRHWPAVPVTSISRSRLEEKQPPNTSQASTNKKTTSKNGVPSLPAQSSVSSTPRVPRASLAQDFNAANAAYNVTASSLFGSLFSVDLPISESTTALFSRQTNLQKLRQFIADHWKLSAVTLAACGIFITATVFNVYFATRAAAGNESNLPDHPHVPFGTATPPQQSRLSLKDEPFFAIRATSNKARPAAETRMTYDNVLTSNNTLYSATNGTWHVTRSGVYWLLAGLAVPGSGRAQLSLHATRKTLMTIAKTHNIYKGLDVVSLERPFHLSLDDEVYVTSKYATAATSAQVPYLVGFHIGSSVADDSAVTFSAASSISQWLNNGDSVRFDVTIMNIGNGWQSSSNQFEAPQDGVYFLSYSVGIKVSQHTCVMIRIDDTDTFCLVDHVSPGIAQIIVAPNEVDVQSGAGMVSLKLGQVVTMKARTSNVYSDAERRQTAMSGFLYSPTRSTYASDKYRTSVAWSVMITDPNYSDASCLWPTALLVNVGDAWNSSIRKVITPVAGYYYLHVETTTYHLSHVEVTLLINGRQEMNIAFRSMSRADNWNCQLAAFQRGSSTLTVLQAGDRVEVNVPQTTSCQYGTNTFTRYTGFTGFLLHPI